MPNRFTDKAGGLMAGHSEKWSNANRRKTSHDAGQGSRGSRNQGTGLAGKANTMPSEVIDTSKMTPAEKLKYFKSLGLMGGSEPEPEVQPQPVKEVPPAPVQNSNTKQFLADVTELLQGRNDLMTKIVGSLKGLSKPEMGFAVDQAYEAMQQMQSKTDDPSRIVNYMLKAIERSKE